MRNLIRESKEYMQEPKPEQFDDVLEYVKAFKDYQSKVRAAKKDIPQYTNNPDYKKILEAGDKKPSKTELKEILNQVRQAIQDRDLPVRDFINKIVERGGVLKNANDAYRDITLSFGRADKLYRDFREGKMDPVLKIIAEKFIKGGKATNFEVMVYMISKHAPERNRKIKSDKLVEWQRTNPEATIDEIREFEQSIAGNDYSGVLSLNSTIDKNGKKTLIKPEYEKDAEGFSNYTVEQFESKFDKQDIKDFWEAVNNASDFVLQRWIAANQITQTEYDRMKKDYQHYIPLKGWWDDASKEFDYHFGQGGGKSLKKAEGRTTLSDHPLAYLEEQGFHSITEQVENEYRSTMLRFVLDNMKGNEDLIRLNRVYFVQNINTGEWDYQLERPSQDMFDAGMAKMVRYSDHFKMRKPSQGREHEVWVDTKYGTYAMVFPENPDVAMALNATNNLVFGMDVSAVNRIFGASIAKFTNIQKALFTSWNVTFPLKNVLRDYGESVSYFLAYDPKIAGAFVKSHPIAFKTAFTYIFNNSKYSPSNNEEHAMFEDFMNMGGQTGWTHQKTPEQYNKQQIKQIKKGLTGKKINIGSAIASYSQLFEDATRFAVYRAAVMNGKSKQDAAFLSKEAVTNFNRKGKLTKTLDSLYAFFNPAIQGAVKNFALAKNKPKQFTYLVSAWTLAGFLVAEACRAFDGDDDEYEKLNPFVRMNYLVIPTGKSYIRIPLPQFFRAFYGLGSNISDMVHGKTEIGEATGRGVLNFINAMSPVDITAFFEKEGKWYAPFIPTIAKPAADLAANRDFMGYEIYKEPFTKDLKDKLANSGLHKKNVNTALKFLTDAAFELGGGEASDEKRKKRYIDNKGEVKKVAGALDINPSVVEYLIKTYTGGTGAVVTDFVDLITLTAGGEFSIDKLPFFNTFVRNFPERRLNALGEYYELKNENDNYFDIAKSKKGTDYEYYKTLMESKKHNEVRVVFDRAEKEIDILKKQHDMNSITLDEYLDKRGEIMENAIKQINE
jgi:hypothetical protein